MRKDYDFLANNRNTPNLKLYTWIIGFSYGMLSINMLITYLYTKLVAELGVAIIFASLIYDKVTNKLRANRGLSYAIGSIIMFSGISLCFAWIHSFFDVVHF